MNDTVQDLRPKVPDSEKITINLGFVDLGRVDLMVRDGFYANRADFIRTAVRNQLDRQEEAVPIQLVAYHTAVFMGKDVDQPRNLAKSVTVE